MLCEVELASKTDIVRGKISYWVVANTLEDAIGKARWKASDTHPEKEQGWTVLEAKVVSITDPVM